MTNSTTESRREHYLCSTTLALGQLGAAAATPEVLTALLHLLADAAANVRRAAARALGQLGAAAATPEVLTALLHTLADADTGVRYATASALQRLSGYVRLPDRSATVKLLLSLTPSSDAQHRNVGYVSLRNLLATESSGPDMSHALASLSQ